MLVNQTDEEANPTEWSQILSSPVAAGAVAVVDRTADVQKAAQAIAEASFGFGGKSAYAPQLVLVNEFVAEPFLSGLVSMFARDLGGGYEKANGRVGGLRETSKEGSKPANIKSIVSGAKGNIIEILDR